VNGDGSSALVSIGRLAARLIRDEAGQDVIEYALLGAFIGTVGIFAWQNIGAGIAAAYGGWDTGVQGISSCTPDPGGGGC
jgi:Flp pilus assembly pilin Flp